MAFNTIWSVDLGKSSLKAVKLRRDRNNIEILAVDKVDYPISKNGVDAATQAKEALGIFRARNEVTDPVVVSHPGQGTFYRSIKVPASDDKKVDAMVGYEASQQIPFPLDEVIWDYHVIDKEYLPGEEREVALFAVRREAIDDFILDFTNEDMNVEMVSIGYLGLLNFVQHDIAPEEPAIVLDIGAAHTDLVLVDGQRFWIRPVPHSGGDVTRAIAQRFKLGYPQAEKLKVESSKVPKQAVKIFQAVIQPKLKELVGEIHRSIGYYRSQAGETTFKHLYLMGNAAKVVGIKKFLEEQLRVQVHRVQSINHFRVNREVNLKLLQANLPSFPTALGCGLQALDVAACEVDLVPQEEKLRKEIGRKRKHFFIAAAALLGLMVVANVMISSKGGGADTVLARGDELASEITKWKREIPDLAEIGSVEKEALRRVGETRGLALDGLAGLEKVLAAFPNAEKREVEEYVDETAASQAKLEEYLTGGLGESLWLTALDIESTRYPGPEVVKNPTDANTVPAAKFTAYVVIKHRGDRKASNDYIAQKFVEPLEEQNRALESKTPEVTLQPGVEMPEIASEQDKYQLDSGQEGGLFYGAQVTWVMTSRDVPAPPKAAGEDDE